MSYEGKNPFKVPRALMQVGGVATSTLSTALTLTLASSQMQNLDPGGASRDVTLPAEEGNDGLWYEFYNAADAAENLVVKDDAAATIITINRGEFAKVGCTGTAWVVVAATGVAGSDFGAVGISTDVVAESTAGAGVTVDGVILKDTTVDVNGTADAIILDADADTTISAPTDDQIDIEIAGADDFVFVANTFRALSGSAIETNTINETTAGSGVTIDSLLIKDGAVDLNGIAGALILDADADTYIGASTDDQIDVTVAGAIDFVVVANILRAQSGSSIETNTINETTAASGVTIDGVLIKDGGATLTGNLKVGGKIVATGTSALVDAEHVDLRANYLIQNVDYVTAAAVTGGRVVNYLPTATATTTAASGVVTAGVDGVSNPTITTAGAATFAATDLVMISGSANDGENDGIYEVQGHAANVLTLKSTSSGITNRVEDFTLDQVTANAGDTGMAITKVTVAVDRAGTDGRFEAGAGSQTGISYSDYLLASDIGSSVQAYDADLAAVAAIAANGLIARTGAGTAAARTLTAPAAGITVSNGDGAAGNPTLALANDLAAYEGLATTGLVVRSGDGTAVTRALTAPAAGITVSNGDGVAGAPTLVLANDLSAVEGLAGTGFAVRTGADAWTNRSIVVGSASLTVANGDGVAGNPSLDTAQNIQTSASPSFAGLTSTGAMTTTDGVAGGTARKVGGKAFGVTADATFADPAGGGDAAETVVSTYTVPASSIKSGTKVRVDFAYLMTVGATVETLVMRLRLGGVGGTVIASSTSADPGTGSGSGYAILVGHAAPGAAAEVAHFGVIKDFAAAGADSTVVQQGPTLTNFATNGALDLVLTADFGAAEAAGGDTVAVRIFEVEMSG